MGDPLAVARCTGVLRRRGMIRLSTDGLSQRLGLHRVPAALLRARTCSQNPDGDGGWAALVVRLLYEATPVNVWDNAAVWPTWRELLPHVLAATAEARMLQPVLDQVAGLLETAGAYLQTRGEPRVALPLYDRAYRLYRRQLGADDPRTLSAALSLGLCMRCWVTTTVLVGSTRKPSLGADACWARTTPSPSLWPAISPRICARWANIRALASWTRTPSRLRPMPEGVPGLVTSALGAPVGGMETCGVPVRCMNRVERLVGPGRPSTGARHDRSAQRR